MTNGVRRLRSTPCGQLFLLARGRPAEGMDAALRAVEILQRQPPGGSARFRLSVWLDVAAHVGSRRDPPSNGPTGPSRSRPRSATVLGRALTESRHRRRHGYSLRRARPGPEESRSAGEISRRSCPRISQIGSGCGEMRRYDVAVPASSKERPSRRTPPEDIRPYQVAWPRAMPIRPRPMGRGEADACDVAAPAVPIARFVGLNTLGWLRARRGDDDVLPLLDEALDFAQEPGTSSDCGPAPWPERRRGWRARRAVMYRLLGETLEFAASLSSRNRGWRIGVWLRASRPDHADAGRGAGRSPGGTGDSLGGPLCSWRWAARTRRQASRNERRHQGPTEALATFDGSALR